MDAASIEQMNKVRASLGMAPLPVPGKGAGGPTFNKSDDSDSEEEEDLSTLDKRHAAASDNWQKLEGERLERIERQKRKDAAKKARDASQRQAKLQGKGLGEADVDEEVDTRTWLVQQKKRQKKIEKARQLEAEMAEREKELHVEYSSKDLAGVRVGHEVDQFDEMTGEKILTLKDAEIGDDSGDDELENQELKANEKLEERLRLRRKQPDYDPTEQGEEKAVLSKYDEEIDGKKEKRFTLDGQGSTVGSSQQLDVDGQTKTNKGIKINLDSFQETTPVSDYLAPSAIKVKKPKRKKDKATRQKTAEEDDIFPVAQEPSSNGQKDDDSMEVDDAGANGSRDTHASKNRSSEFDDEDLHAALAEQRRQALKKRKRTGATALVTQMRDEMPVDGDDPEDSGLLIDETSEFVANLKKPDAAEAEEEDRGRPLQPATYGQMDLKDEEDGDGDTAMAERTYAGIEANDDLEAELRRETSTSADATGTGLEDEETMTGHGVGASLALLRKRGLIGDNGPEDLAAKERQRAKFLSEKQHLVDAFDARAREQREVERRSGRWEKMSHKDRDTYARQQNEAREQYLSRLQADMFNAQYRPDVKLQYHDEYGRSMNQKEAFKHLSHMFHGKGSGKQKTEKRLKKIDDEKKNMAKGVLNVGEEGGMMNVQGREGKRTKQAGVRLQ